MAAPGLRAPRPVWPPLRRARRGAPRRASGGRARHPNFPFWAIFLPERESAHTQRPARTGGRHPPRRGAPNTLPAPPPSPPPSARPAPPPSSTSPGSRARGPGPGRPPAPSFPLSVCCARRPLPRPRPRPSIAPLALLRCPGSGPTAPLRPARRSPRSPRLGRARPPLGSARPLCAAAGTTPRRPPLPSPCADQRPRPSLLHPSPPRPLVPQHLLPCQHTPQATTRGMGSPSVRLSLLTNTLSHIPRQNTRISTSRKSRDPTVQAHLTDLLACQHTQGVKRRVLILP